MGEEKKESCCEDTKGCGCGCDCRCGKALLLVLLFLVGGIIGFLMGRCGPCGKKMMMCHPSMMAGPATPGEPAK